MSNLDLARRKLGCHIRDLIPENTGVPGDMLKNGSYGLDGTGERQHGTQHTGKMAISGRLCRPLQGQVQLYSPTGAQPDNPERPWPRATPRQQEHSTPQQRRTGHRRRPENTVGPGLQ